MRNVYKGDPRGKGDGECVGVRSHVSHYVDVVTHGYESYVLGGYLYQGIKPDRSVKSKWQLTKAFYPNDVLPPYLSGTAYLATGNIVPHLLEGARHTPVIPLEDVYITGLVASERLKLRLRHLAGFERFRPRFEAPCAYQSLLTAHGFTAGQLRVATQATFDLPKGACGGLLTRAGVALNGFITTLFPRLPSAGLTDDDVDATI